MAKSEDEPKACWHVEGLDGPPHFLTRTLDRVSTEMSLHVLAYNFKRVLNLLGNSALMAAMKA